MSVISVPISRARMLSISRTTVFRSTGRSSIICLRLNARSLRVISAARSPAARISDNPCLITTSVVVRRSSSSLYPFTTVRSFKVMSDAAGEPPDGLQFLRLPQLFLERFVLRNVLDRSCEFPYVPSRPATNSAHWRICRTVPSGRTMRCSH